MVVSLDKDRPHLTPIFRNTKIHRLSKEYGFNSWQKCIKRYEVTN